MKAIKSAICLKSLDASVTPLTTIVFYHFLTCDSTMITVALFLIKQALTHSNLSAYQSTKWSPRTLDCEIFHSCLSFHFLIVVSSTEILFAFRHIYWSVILSQSSKIHLISLPKFITLNLILFHTSLF